MKSKYVFFVASVFLLFSLTAWSASTKEILQDLKTQVAVMQDDLDEIKEMLKDLQTTPRAAAPAAAPQAAGFREQVISIGNSPFKGEVDAPVTVVEYTDYQCPYCARHYRDVMPALNEEYIETGKIRFIMRENPLTAIHPQAMNASMAALCADDQDKYWEMHDQMFENQSQLAIENLKSYAADIGLDTTKFNECLDNKEPERRIQRDLASAAKLGARSTPGFLIGLTDSDDPDKVNMSVYIRGAQSIDQFRASINDLLESAEDR